ncbi:RNA-directed DNA polymerase, eukaryota, reverse transcriptase zinc-binding domain protein [Tanacetum coccineum]
MDICSTGFYFTWTKSLKNPESAVLKKLDRMMVNEEFIQKFCRANGIFHPFLISDHSAALLIKVSQKSSIFFGSIMENKKRELLEVMPLKCGKLPMKYLGVPLLAKRLGVNDLTVAKELDKLFKRFLWNSGDSAKGKARVAWDSVCRPKDQGGASIWQINETSNDSWGWKNMLLIRDKIKPFISYKIGNGKEISAWHDKWCSIGPLDRFFFKRDIYEARYEDAAKIIDMISHGRWNWPEEWTNDYPELHQIPVPSLNEQIKDKVFSLDANLKEVPFSTKAAWLSLRDSWPKVQWSHVIWFSQYNPRQAFILWLAIQEKLMTQDKILQWNQGVNLKCSFCLGCEDSHDHLFFQCHYLPKVWDKLKDKGNLHNAQNSLVNVVSIIATKNVKNNIWCILQKLLVAYVVYHLWQERNKRIFQNEYRNDESLCNCIKEDMMNKLSTLTMKNSSAVRKFEYFVSVGICAIVYVQGIFSNHEAFERFSRQVECQLSDALGVGPILNFKGVFALGDGSQSEHEFSLCSCDAYFKSLYVSIELDQWLSHWGFKDTKLEIGELDVSEKLDCIESALEFNEKLDFDMKAKMELSGIKTIDGKDAEFGGFDLNIDQSELIFGRINNADDKDEVFGGLDLNIAHSELGFADDKNEFFGGLDLNIAQTEFGFPRTNKVDEKDKVLSGLNEKKIDLSSENFVKTVDIKHNDDTITKLCPMDVLSSQSKNNTIILSKNVKTVGRPRKRKKEEPISSFKMLEWLANAARNPHGLTFGSIPRISKWKKYKGNEVWKQVLLVKETLFAKQNVDSCNKLDCSQV